MEAEMSLAVFDPFKALAVKVQAEDAALQIDHTTPDGETKLRSWVRTVRGYRAGLEKIRVRAKADALEYGRKVDGLAKKLKSPFDTIITDRMKPLDEIEDAKRKAAEAIVEAERVAKEKAEADRLADLERREKEAVAKEAKFTAANNLLDAKQREFEQYGREKTIAAEAAVTATKEAEEKAERERLAAIAAAHAEQHRLDDIERKRVADVEHRESVEADIVKALFPFFGTNSVTARNIIAAINSGAIPHVTINY
ncbi:hypothetical protein LCGC14_2785240 [marine sediment metagenome]|uniref:Uncharacterized protein n=1 Tax=marine sediment metagenome TaxID=412755 RepID=A0A0F9BIJ3_9ZZZZ